MAQRVALVIGNDDYHDPTLARLTAPQADIAAFADLLEDPQRGAFDKVQILRNRPQGDVRREMARFFHDRHRDDLLLLYFSGHGVLDAEGQLYLATPDTERDLLDATAVTAYYVNRLMRRCRSRRQVLILDCCHSGAFDRSAKGGGVGTQVGIGEAFAGDGTGHIVLAASKATEYAFEGDEVTGSAQTSVFTGALIEGMRTGDADLDEDGYITPEELYDYVYHRVRQLSPRQTPGKWVYEQTGELILARSPRRRLPDELQAQLDETDPMIRFRAVDELASLARGDDAATARLANEKLEELAASDDSFTVRRAASSALQEASQTAPTTRPAGTVAREQVATEASNTPSMDPVTAEDFKVPVITWTDVWPVALAWFLAGIFSLGPAYVTKYGTTFLLTTGLALVVATGYTFDSVLRWVGARPSEAGVQVVVGLLGLVPLVGPGSFAALVLMPKISWGQLSAVQRVLALVYTVAIVATHGYLLWLIVEFWRAQVWWEFFLAQLELNLMFLVHGAVLFVGALILLRTVVPRERPNG